MYERQTTTIKEKPPIPLAARQAEELETRRALIFNSAKIRFFTYHTPRKILFFNTFRLISAAAHNGLGHTLLYTTIRV